MAAIQWSDAERRAWAWPDRQMPSIWCESAPVYIPDNGINPEPGPYSFGRTPYWRAVLDLVVDKTVREIWVYKPTQVGYTRLMINLIGYFVDQDPGALGLLMPDEDSVREIFGEEIQPTIAQTPALRSHLSPSSWDTKKHTIKLDTMPIFGVYAGSVQKLARRSLRYAILDEIDKYRPFRREAPPIQLIKKRLSNWLHRARLLAGSTPTTRHGNIAAGYEGCPDKREYFCRCPHCGHFELWQWSGVKGFKAAPAGTKEERANWIRLNQPAYFECSACKAKITDADKSGAVANGVWVSGVSENGIWRATQTVQPDGTLKGERIVSTKVGLHLTSIISPWLSFSDLAAEFVEAEGDADKTRDFRNNRLALPWDEVARIVRPSIVREKREISGPPLLVPSWAVVLYATFDTQRDWFAGCIRAWGWGFKSQLIWHGRVDPTNLKNPAGKPLLEAMFDEVFRLGMSEFPVEGSGPASGGSAGSVPAGSGPAGIGAAGVPTMRPHRLLIDSGGDRTADVYEFAKRDERIIATKGMSQSSRGRAWFDTQIKAGVTLRMLDTHYYKTCLFNLMTDPDQSKWLPHREATEQYCLEMASEHCIRGKHGEMKWVPTGTVRNEAWDLETLQRAAADFDNIGTQPALPAEPPLPPRPRVWVNPKHR